MTTDWNPEAHDDQRTADRDEPSSRLTSERQHEREDGRLDLARKISRAHEEVDQNEESSLEIGDCTRNRSERLLAHRDATFERRTHRRGRSDRIRWKQIVDSTC